MTILSNPIKRAFSIIVISIQSTSIYLIILFVGYIAVIIVLAMNLVGSLLISALVIFPALSAMRVFGSFKAVTICAAILSVICALIGLVLSLFFGTPVGSTIVATDIAAFGLFSLIGALGKRKG